MRYATLLEIVERVRPHVIVETGTWMGVRAIEMAEVALRHHPTVSYLGFDLFEEATAESDAAELNVKQHARLADVQARLARFRVQHPGFSFKLVRGNTRLTLPETVLPPRIDLVFLDGGHSLETIARDWTSLMHAGTVVLDDYYLPDAAGRRPDITRFGCNALVDGLDEAAWHVAVHAAQDPVRDGGVVALAEVRSR